MDGVRAPGSGGVGVTLQLKLTATAAQRHHQSFMIHHFKAGLRQKDSDAKTRGEPGGIRFSPALRFCEHDELWFQ